MIAHNIKNVFKCTWSINDFEFKQDACVFSAIISMSINDIDRYLPILMALDSIDPKIYPDSELLILFLDGYMFHRDKCDDMDGLNYLRKRRYAIWSRYNNDKKDVICEWLEVIALKKYSFAYYDDVVSAIRYWRDLRNNTLDKRLIDLIA